MTALDLPAIRALHAGASEGPWDVNDDGEIFDADFCLVVGTKWPHGAPTRQLKLDPNNAAFIAAAPSIVTQLLAVVERVESLHKPVKKWEPYEGAGYSYATREQALEAAGEVDLNSVAIEAGPQFFEVCGECSRVEGEQLAEIGEEWGYRESLWPCPTIQAITGEGQ